MFKFLQKILKPEIRDRSIDVKAMAAEGAFFLDVRTPEEFAEVEEEAAELPKY